MYKQVVIARKDLEMSPGKLAAQVSHASMAFLTKMIRDNAFFLTREEKVYAGKREPALYKRSDLTQWAQEAFNRGEEWFYVKPIDIYRPNGKLELCENPTMYYKSLLELDKDLYEEWINGIFTKTVLQAKNRSQLLKAKTMAEEMGMIEGEDFFLIKDCCLTELEPEEVDENGVGRTLTCIGFRPMESEVIDKIGKKFQLYR